MIPVAPLLGPAHPDSGGALSFESYQDPQFRTVPPKDICTVVLEGAGPAPVVNRPDVLVNVTFLTRPAPAGEIVIRGKFRPDRIRGHGQLAGPERLAKRRQRLRAGIFFTYRKGIAPSGWPPAVSRVRWLAAAFCPAAPDSLGHL